MNMTIVAAVLGGLAIGAIILVLLLNREYQKKDSITLVQYRLENSDSAIIEAMSYLKITNEWSDNKNVQ